MNRLKLIQQDLDGIDWRLIEMIGQGIPYSSMPYREIARKIGISETEVFNRLRYLRQSGIIKRFGIIVRHHELGYRSNAMVVWNIPDEHVKKFAGQLTKSDAVHLCYLRPRKMPIWPYNLFCMVHGKDRNIVRNQVKQLAAIYEHGEPEYDILFSKRRFKQRGMRYTRDYSPADHDEEGNLAHG